MTGPDFTAMYLTKSRGLVNRCLYGFFSFSFMRINPLKMSGRYRTFLLLFPKRNAFRLCSLTKMRSKSRLDRKQINGYYFTMRLGSKGFYLVFSFSVKGPSHFFTLLNSAFLKETKAEAVAYEKAMRFRSCASHSPELSHI